MRGPSRWWYLVAVVLLAGAAAGGTYGLVRIKHHLAAMPRVVMPGEATLHLGEGGYLAFYEQRSVVAGQVFDTGELGAMACTMREVGGEAVTLNRTEVATSYQMGAYAGSAVFGFDAPHDADYVLACRFDAPRADRLVVAIGRGLGDDIALTAVAALGPGLLGLAALLVVFFWRRAARRAA